MKRYFAIVVFFILSGLFCLTSVGVFGDEPPQSSMLASLYSDIKAKKIGDPLYVIISESNSATKSAQTSTNKQNKGSVEGEATTGALEGLFPGMGASIDYGSQYRGEASTSPNAKLTSRMTVLVVDVLPNGNLVVEGTKTMEINNDIEVITLSGIVKPEHISSSNTLYSYQIANAKLLYKGKGSMTQGQRIGLLGRIINWIF